MAPNVDAYYERRDLVLDALRVEGPVLVLDLRNLLGWGHYEVTGKLQSLRMEGLAVYDAGYWSAA